MTANNGIDILTGKADAAQAINTEGAAHATHAMQVTDAQGNTRTYLTAAQTDTLSTPTVHRTYSDLLVTIDELTQAFGEFEGEAETARVRLITMTEQRDRAWTACCMAAKYLSGDGNHGSVGMDVVKSLLNAAAAEAAKDGAQ